MISVAEALSLVLNRVPGGATETVALAQATSRVLAESITSDVDSPPHDKSIVDGFAVRASDLAAGPAELAVVEAIMAGMTPRRTIAAGEAARIMTGAPLPEGADSVVMVERTSPLPPGDSVDRVRIDDPAFRPGQNIVRRAAVMRAGDLVMAIGTCLRPIEIGLLAEVGSSAVSVHRRPSVAVLSTGNELVSHGELPGPGQIRNSNGPLLAAAIEQAGGVGRELGIGRDDPVPLRESIRAGLDADFLLVSGGVSMGDLDLVPGIFRELGVEEVFHKVQLKPGKPLWFGVRRGARATLVFGLPGNPVSSLVCFLLFARPAMRRFMGLEECDRPRPRARLIQSYRQRGARETYAPAHAQWTANGLEVATLPSLGSGDLRSLAAANALAHFPAGDRDYPPGEVIEIILLDN